MKKAKTSTERLHHHRVAALGCVVCRNEGLGKTPAEVHHIRTGQGAMRASHFDVIPLCHTHHRTGGYGVAYHAGAAAWQESFGREVDLLAQTRKELDFEMAYSSGMRFSGNNEVTCE